MRALPFLLIAACSVLFAGCEQRVARGDDDSVADDDDLFADDDDSGPDDDDVVADDDDTSVDDDDTSVDDDDTSVDDDDTSVDDDDSATVNAPAAVVVDGHLSFQVNTLGSLAGVNDCETVFNGTVTAPALQPCAECQASYEGPATYPVDQCSAEAGTPSPATVNFGFVFTSPTSWDVYSGDGAGTYTYVGAAQFDGASSYILTRTDAVDAPLVGDVGDLTTILTFTP